MAAVQSQVDRVAKYIGFLPAEHHDTYPAIDPSKANLSGKSVLITGVSRGIGLATAVSYAAAGCSQIALAARSDLSSAVAAVKAAAKQAGRSEPQVLALSLDVSSESSTRAAAEAVEAAFGGALDVVVANAGASETRRLVGKSEPDDWWRTWEVNVRGTYLTARFFLPLLLRPSSPTTTSTRLFVAVASAGAHAVFPTASSYQTGKLALCRFVEFLDAEYASRGLVAVSLNPGAVPTELALGLGENIRPFLVDKPELPADVMVWLAGKRREWLGGRYISVCWDVDELEKRRDEIVSGDLLKFRMAI